MNTKNTMHEQISAFADGEADESLVEVALAALRTPEGRAAWEDYHQIGDVLRSDDMALPMSGDFTAKLMRRLDNEPAIVAAPCRQRSDHISSTLPNGGPDVSASRRFMLPGLAAAVMAVLTAVVVQQWLGTTRDVSDTDAPAIASAAPSSARMAASVVTVGTANVSQERDLKRDPGIDEYLLAHQRFSPSLYSTAQYARSATFAADSDK